MSQVLCMQFAKVQLPQPAVFLDEWESIGTSTPIGDNVYELLSQSGDKLLLVFNEGMIEISGCSEDDTFEFIENFSKNYGGELLLEGEPPPSKQDKLPWKNSGPFAKISSIALIIISIPIIIAVLPLLLIVLFVRLIFHLFRSSWGSYRPKP